MTISSLIGVLLSSLCNPNLAWEEYSHRMALAEVEVVAMMARLMGYDPDQAGGMFTFGGTGTTLYGIKMGLEKSLPVSMDDGIREDAIVFASDSSHYFRYNIAGWLGLGAKNLMTIPTTVQNAMDLHVLRAQARLVLKAGQKIAGIIATLGTTDAFGVDELRDIAMLRDELVEEFSLSYRPHIHADAVIGWAWSVFNDYSFENNPLDFRPRTVRALAGACQNIRHLAMADSIGIDFHKPGFAPYISSLILVQHKEDLQLLQRPQDQMPYLYQFGEQRPGMCSLETSRPGTGVLAALANLKLFGKEGLRVVIGHIVEMAQLLREHLESHECIRKAWPVEGVMLSLTDCYRRTDYGEPIVALKSFILSPFVDEDNVETVVRKVLEARKVLTS